MMFTKIHNQFFQGATIKFDINIEGSYGWGLKYPEVYVLGRRCIEPRTCQAIEREPYSEEGAKYREQVTLGYNQIEKSQLRWCENQVDKLRKEYTLERFFEEWCRKNNLLK